MFVTDPSASSTLICEIPNNNTLTIYDIVRKEDQIWLYTEYNGTWGWILLTQTVTPQHNYQIPDYIRDWDGTIAGVNNNSMGNGAVVDVAQDADVALCKMKGRILL